MSDYGDEIIVKQVVSNNDKSPVMRAEITVGGKKYKAGLWLWTRKDGSPVLDKAGLEQHKGKIEPDDYQAAPKAAQQSAPIGFADMDEPPY